MMTSTQVIARAARRLIFTAIVALASAHAAADFHKVREASVHDSSALQGRLIKAFEGSGLELRRRIRSQFTVPTTDENLDTMIRFNSALFFMWFAKYAPVFAERLPLIGIDDVKDQDDAAHPPMHVYGFLPPRWRDGSQHIVLCWHIRGRPLLAFEARIDHKQYDLPLQTHPSCLSFLRAYAQHQGYTAGLIEKTYLRDIKPLEDESMRPGGEYE